MEDFQCAVVIPCLNEERTIAHLVRRVTAIVPAVWVVDDGSADNTGAEARSAGATVTRHPVNTGKGAALRTGLSDVRAAGFEWAITMDGDGQHDPSDIPSFIRSANNGGDLIVGNRMWEAPESMSRIRLLTNRWMSRLISRRAGLDCLDSQCGFRMIRLGAWAQLRLKTERFEVESEMLVAFARAGFNVRFVPVHCQPHRRPSRIRPVPDAIRWFRWWFNLRSGLAVPQ